MALRKGQTHSRSLTIVRAMLCVMGVFLLEIKKGVGEGHIRAEEEPVTVKDPKHVLSSKDYGSFMCRRCFIVAAIAASPFTAAF
jgi:hypothetical protein